jgi:hypothetical protein
LRVVESASEERIRVLDGEQSITRGHDIHDYLEIGKLPTLFLIFLIKNSIILHLLTRISLINPIQSNGKHQHQPRPIMYSIGVLISLEGDPILEEFLFSHYSLIENKLHQLQAVVSKTLRSLLRKSSSNHLLYIVSIFSNRRRASEKSDCR